MEKHIKGGIEYVPWTKFGDTIVSLPARKESDMRSAVGRSYGWRINAAAMLAWSIAVGAIVAGIKDNSPYSLCIGGGFAVLAIMSWCFWRKPIA